VKPKEVAHAAAQAPATNLVFDPELALRRCCDSEKMLQEMKQCFFTDADELLAEMRAKLVNGDLEEVSRLGHRLKGTVVYLGAEAADAASHRVEQFCTAGGSLTEAKLAIDALERECAVLKAALHGNPQASST
jgi:HPt (histidine-containing phosphotransfer) domain-containing protein